MEILSVSGVYRDADGTWKAMDPKGFPNNPQGLEAADKLKKKLEAMNVYQHIKVKLIRIKELTPA